MNGTRDVKSEINQSSSGSLGAPQPSHKKSPLFSQPIVSSIHCRSMQHIYFNSGFDCGTEGEEGLL